MDTGHHNLLELSHNFLSAKFCPYFTKGKRKINVKKVFQNVDS